MTRPAGESPEPSTDASYPAGTDPWSGTPTKVDPGAAAIAAGFVPKARLAAQHVNWLLREYGRWIKYQDRIEVQNWRAHGVMFSTDDDEIHIQEARNVIVYSAALSRYFIGCRDATDDEIPIVTSSPSGAPSSWVDTGAPTKTATGPNQTYQIVADTTGRILGWLTKSDTSYFAVRSAAGSWSGFSTNQPTFRAFVARFFGGKWVVGGVAANVPVVYQTTPADVWTAETLTGAAATEAIVDMTAATAGILALGSLGNVWFTDTLGSAWDQTPVGDFDSKPTGIVSVTPEGLFWVLCEDGEVYTSDDGTTWTRRYGPAPGAPVPSFPGATTVGWAGCASLGGVVVAAALAATPEGSGTIGVLAVGWNEGESWEYITPPTSANVADESPFQVVSTVENRIAIFRENGSGSNGAALYFSLRIA